MNGPIAQMAALTCYINAQRRGLSSGGFYPGNSTFQHCEYVWFGTPKWSLFSREQKWKIVANTPQEWMDNVVGGSFDRAILDYQPSNDPGTSDRMSAGFVGGGGRWRICLERKGRANCWEARWTVGDRNASDNRIWRVMYGLKEENAIPPPPIRTLETLALELKELLESVEEVARRRKLTSFADQFVLAQSCLVSQDPLSMVYHRDLTTLDVVGIDGARMLAACQACWVFGGMGSWNDMGFDGEEQREYEELSGHLFSACKDGICAAVNRSGPQNNTVTI